MRIRMSYRLRETLFGYGFISLWIIGFIIFTAQPIVYSIYLSFQSVLITATGVETTFIGFQNYKDAFLTDPTFSTKLIEFLNELLFTVPIVIVFSIIIAMLLNLKIRFKGLFRVIFFLPVIIMSGPVIQELIDRNAFELTDLSRYAIINYIQYDMNIGFASTLLVSLMENLILILWYTGIQVLIFLAALQKIDSSIYEASRIDGASPWESFWKITLPTIVPMIFVNIIYTIVTLSTFELNEVSAHISKSMFDVGLGFGFASSLSWIYFLILAVILGITALVFNPPEKKQKGR